MSLLDTFFPSYLSDSVKDRLKVELSQFSHLGRKKSHGFVRQNTLEERQYSDFYLPKSQMPYFMQGDLLSEVRLPVWSNEEGRFKTFEGTGVLLSNTCDIVDEKRGADDKYAILAPAIPLNDYQRRLGRSANSVLPNIRSQFTSNIIYYPPNPTNSLEYIVNLDRIWSIPKDVINSSIPNISSKRIASLTLFGFYLLILKLSYHFCRLPEQAEEREIATEELFKIQP